MPVAFIQPSSANGNLLGTKCFAYSTLNALAHNNVPLPNIANQVQADTWISSQKKFQSIGGGPNQVLTALNLNPKQVAFPVSDNLFNKANYAVQHGLSAVLATTVGTAHWIFLTGVIAAQPNATPPVPAQILAEDQQNPTRGVLAFKYNGKNYTAQYLTSTGTTITYTLNGISVFITTTQEKDALTAA